MSATVMTMILRFTLFSLLVLLPLEARAEDLDELEALQITVRRAIKKIEQFEIIH